ncbi:hypothetical protein ACFY72_35030 [Streptomyces globisporus]|uniref:hypothetical protein n=1 Tax=Streptomyces globisporus TaxID=1908 RepID=UPI0036AEF85E
MNGEQHKGEDPGAPVTVTTDQSAPSDQQQAAHQRQLTAAGYGEEQRTRYIEGSSEGPEYAACAWDEQIVPGAEAAGIIPENPSPFSTAEQAHNAAHSHAVSEYWQRNPDDRWASPWDADPAREAEYKEFVAARTTQILQEIGPDLVERIERSGNQELTLVANLYAEREAPEPDDAHEIDI